MKTRMAENANIKENEIQKEIKKETGEEQKMLKNEYLSEINLDDRFELREIRLGEAVEAAGVEKACFPPSEACSEKMMVERATKAPEYFLVAVDRQTGKIAGILNGLATDETTFSDEFFTNAELHVPEGKTVMLLGLAVLPEYRGEGLARALMYRYLCRMVQKEKDMVLLTCLDSRVPMYEKMGFQDKGAANSTWGGEEWHEMNYPVGIGKLP